jgi:predicted DNA-binding transcriptional regulator AlpA
MSDVLEQVKQEQEKKNRTLQQLQAKRPNRGQRARRCNKAPEKPSQRKDAEDEPAKPLAFVSTNDILARIPITRTTLWNWTRAGKFPRPYALGPRTVWLASEVDEFIRTRPMRNYKDMEGA